MTTVAIHRLHAGRIIMREFNGNWATSRRKRGLSSPWLVTLFGFVFWTSGSVAHASSPSPHAAAAGEHETPPAAEKPVTPEPTKPTETKPRKPPVAVPKVPPRVTRMLADDLTGLALGGLDPVSYFTEAKPRAGLEEIQLDWNGATWRFVNEGNAAAFEMNPEVYAPRFAGRCAYQVSRGFAAEGAPSNFLIIGDRLYLFANPAFRAAFLADTARMIAAAEAQWPALAREQP